MSLNELCDNFKPNKTQFFNSILEIRSYLCQSKDFIDEQLPLLYYDNPEYIENTYNGNELTQEQLTPHIEGLPKDNNHTVIKGAAVKFALALIEIGQTFSNIKAKGKNSEINFNEIASTKTAIDNVEFCNKEIQNDYTLIEISNMVLSKITMKFLTDKSKLDIEPLVVVANLLNDWFKRNKIDQWQLIEYVMGIKNAA